jgi:hypothetical protein
MPLRPSRGGSAVPEPLGILGPIPTIPSGCVVALIAAGADVLSRPCPPAALSPEGHLCPRRALANGYERLRAVNHGSWRSALTSPFDVGAGPALPLGSAFQARDRGATIGAHSTGGSRTTADTGGRPSRSSAAPFGQQHRSSDHPGSLSHGGSRLSPVRAGSVPQRSRAGSSGHQQSPTVRTNRRSSSLQLKQQG